MIAGYSIFCGDGLSIGTAEEVFLLIMFTVAFGRVETKLLLWFVILASEC